MLPNNLLPDFVLKSRVHGQWQYSGMDSSDNCLNQEFFFNYPYQITYRYNMRGFRDVEWPDDEKKLQQSIWCIGDSFTVGIGQPFEHTWPQVLQHTTGYRTINVSLDGASNNWIARRTKDIVKSINPACIIIMWSYVERRELDQESARQQEFETWYNECKDISWPPCPNWNRLYLLPKHVRNELRDIHNMPVDSDVTMFNGTDEGRRIQNVNATDEQNFENWCDCINQVANISNIVHCMIPKFAPCSQSEKYFEYLQKKNLTSIGECKQLDFARDRHHFDLNTSQNLVRQIVPLLNIF